jgi:hypothetical protein
MDGVTHYAVWRMWLGKVFDHDVVDIRSRHDEERTGRTQERGGV